MDYEKEIYAYVKARPGCRIHEIISHIEGLYFKEFEGKSNFYKLMAKIPLIGFVFFHDDTGAYAWARSHVTIQSLEDEGLITVAKDALDKTRVYPTGKKKLNPAETAKLEFSYV